MPLHAMTKAAVLLPLQIVEKGLKPPFLQSCIGWLPVPWISSQYLS